MSIHQRFSVNPYPWQRWVFDQFRAPDVAEVLELGAGTGDLWLDNPDRIPPGWSITLNDLSPGMLAAAAKRLTQISQIAGTAVVDAQEIPYSDASFDLVVANMMLYHVPDRPTALSEIRRVLKPGAALSAATVGDAHLHELLALGPPGEFLMGGEFTLENGGAQLEPFFDHIELKEFEDALEVSDPAAVVDYLLSAPRADGLPNNRTTLETTVQAYFAIHGRLHVTKAAGLFLAH